MAWNDKLRWGGYENRAEVKKKKKKPSHTENNAMGHFVFIKGHLWVIHSFGEIGFVICCMNCDWMVKTYFCDKKEQIQKNSCTTSAFYFGLKTCKLLSLMLNDLMLI